MGVAIAAATGGTGREDVLALVGSGFGDVATALGSAAFVLVCLGFAWLILRRPDHKEWLA